MCLHILSKYNYHHVDACQVYVKEGLLYLKRLNTSMIIVIKEKELLKTRFPTIAFGQTSQCPPST